MIEVYLTLFPKKKQKKIATLYIHSFIQSFISMAPLQVHYRLRGVTQRRSRHSTDTVLEFHVEASQATASEELAQGSYVEGFEPATLRTKGAESINEPLRLVHFLCASNTMIVVKP